MATEHLVPKDLSALYEVLEWRNATGVLQTACPEEWAEIIEVLRTFRLYRSDIIVGGKNRSTISKRLDGGFYKLGWEEKQFDTHIVIDGNDRSSPTHKVDCFKKRVALEVEWNNKDPFYDRDLNNFRLLFDLGAIDVGLIVTRSDELQDLFKSIGRYSSYGQSTTHMSKLIPRIEGGGGGGCPILVLGITKALYIDGDAPELKED